MNDLLLFLTSKEIMIVYILILAIVFLSIVVWLIERSYYKRKLRHNTKELNRLVDEVGERLVEEEKKTEVPVTTIEATVPTKEVEVLEPVTESIEVKPVVEEKKEEIEYETVEDEQLQAQEEIRKITESLIDTNEEPIENIALTKFEEEQEKNSIISIDELMATKEMYKVEELNKYDDENNVILSINELENLKNNTVKPELKPDNEPVKLTVVAEKDIRPNVKVVEEKKPVSTFKSSPVISPIYGLEKEEVEKHNVMNLENSATYDKFDEEIRKTNEFLNTLKELQKKLD